MFRPSYPGRWIAAIAEYHPIRCSPRRWRGRHAPALLLLGLAAVLALAGCQAKKPVTQQPKPVQSFTRLAAPPQVIEEVQALMRRARSGEEPGAILAAFDRLIQAGAPLVRSEAAFRKAQLMLEWQWPGAVEAMLRTMEQYPQHALAPYAHFWLAKYWVESDEPGRALDELTQALRHPRLTRELADKVLTLGSGLVADASERDALRWLLAAAEADQGGRDGWLRLAARRASLETIRQMHQDGSLPAELMAGLDLHLARGYLMNGDMDALKVIADLLSTFQPGSPEEEQVRAWASGEVRAIRIGALLPLTGQYARYGEQALRGLRLALAEMRGGDQIHLYIEDTGGNGELARRAYQRLLAQQVDMVIGPLLGDVAEALIPDLRPDLPVISFTGRTGIAAASPALFVHTLSPLAQVEFMARYAWRYGAQRIAIIAEDDKRMLSEAEHFQQTFEALGGEIVDTLILQPGVLDHRPELMRLRYETDDEELLAELDQDLALFLPDLDMEIVMPVHFDALYLAMRGKQVALLAGQLAYTDIRDIPIYGSSRWLDGHLLDDQGRYLAAARFTAVRERDDEVMRRLRFLYREAWGEDEMSLLTLLAYDTMSIAAVAAGRLGLRGEDLIRALHDPGGFPVMTGHVYFDDAGVSQKRMDVYGISKGRIIPAG